MPWARCTLRLLVAVSVALGATSPASLRAAEPTTRKDESVVRAGLELDTKALGEDGELVSGQIRVRGEALLRKHEVLPAKAEHDPRIVVAVEPLGDDGPGYRCRFGVYRDEALVEGSDGVSVCKLCTETELVDHVEAAIERVVANVPRESGAVAEPKVAPRVDPGPTDGRKPLGPLGKAGIGVSVVGVVALAAGIPLAAITPKGVDGLEPPKDPRPKHVAGIVLVGVGTAALVTGLALIAVDRHRARKRARATVVPTGAGLAIVGRF